MFIVLLYYFYRTFATLFISVLTDGAAEDAAGAERRMGRGWGMPRSSHVHPARVGSDARRVIAVWALLSGSMMGFLSVGLLVGDALVYALVYALGEERGDFVGGEAELKRTVPLK